MVIGLNDVPLQRCHTQLLRLEGHHWNGQVTVFVLPMLRLSAGLWLAGWLMLLAGGTADQVLLRLTSQPSPICDHQPSQVCCVGFLFYFACGAPAPWHC